MLVLRVDVKGKVPFKLGRCLPGDMDICLRRVLSGMLLVRTLRGVSGAKVREPVVRR